MYELKVHLHLIFTVECGLIVGVFKLFHLVNGSSDNPNKTLVVHIVLPITITWREVDEFTSKTLFFIIQQKKETIFVFFSFYNPILLVLATFQCHLNWSMLGFLIPDSEMVYLPDFL